MSITSFQLNNLTTDELLDLNKQVVGIIKARRKANVQEARSELRLGCTVEFKAHGRTIEGTVTKIMRTRCIVETQWGNYRCYISGLNIKGA